MVWNEMHFFNNDTAVELYPSFSYNDSVTTTKKSPPPTLGERPSQKPILKYVAL
jgi:hypothetical protein